MAVISLEKVNKYYYSRRRLVHAVKDLDMEIKEGEFVSIVGPSGCGKSSTMRMIAGLEGITDGAIRFDGKVVNAMSPAERNVALAFESYALYQHMTVRENISFCLRNKKLSRQQIKEQVDWVTELLSIGNILELKPVSLSGGQQQLVSLARALVRNPSVTLLDEPISHLDSRSRKDISLAIRRVHRELGLTLIYVTHNQEEAFALADRIAVMNEGVLQQVGTREEILSKPANLFVAETAIIGLMSGLIAIGFTYLASFIINIIVKEPLGAPIAIFPWNYAIIMVLISIALTMMSGLIPSRSAAKKDPVDALRAE